MTRALIPLSARQAVKAFPDLTEKVLQEVVRDQFIEGLFDE